MWQEKFFNAEDTFVVEGHHPCNKYTWPPGVRCLHAPSVYTPPLAQKPPGVPVLWFSKCAHASWCLHTPGLLRLSVFACLWCLYISCFLHASCSLQRLLVTKRLLEFVRLLL